MNRYHHHHRRRGPSLSGPLAGAILVAGLVGAPFYALWHPLGDVVGVAVFLLVGIPVCVDHLRRSRRPDVAVRATATARVRRG